MREVTEAVLPSLLAICPPDNRPVVIDVLDVEAWWIGDDVPCQEHEEHEVEGEGQVVEESSVAGPFVL